MSTYIAELSTATYFVTQSSSLCPFIHSTNLSTHSSIYPLTYLSSYTPTQTPKFVSIHLPILPLLTHLLLQTTYLSICLSSIYPL